MIRVQREDFDIGRELERLAAGDRTVGGVASFIGLVRDMGGTDTVSALTLEHYPGMTDKKLAEIEAEANRRWPLSASLIIHRYGRLNPGDRIVLVSDGVNEAQNREGEFFGDERLEETVSQGKDLFAAVSDFAQGAPPSDDCTTVELEYLRA